MCTYFTLSLENCLESVFIALRRKHFCQFFKQIIVSEIFELILVCERDFFQTRAVREHDISGLLQLRVLCEGHLLQVFATPEGSFSDGLLVRRYLHLSEVCLAERVLSDFL